MIHKETTGRITNFIRNSKTESFLFFYSFLNEKNYIHAIRCMHACIYFVSRHYIVYITICIYTQRWKIERIYINELKKKACEGTQHLSVW